MLIFMKFIKFGTAVDIASEGISSGTKYQIRKFR
jgi:hypothetical protein